MGRNSIRLLATATAVFFLAVGWMRGGQAPASAGQSAQSPRSLRLYVLDCGTLHIADLSRFRMQRDEVATPDMSVPCFLVAHAKGTLLWDAGAVPDNAWTPTGQDTLAHIVLPDKQQREVTMRKPLQGQLTELGYSPSGITYLALSHYHYDHTANANAFANATWLVRPVERDAMFSEKPAGTTQPSSYSALRNSKTLLLETEAHDVFGDETVIIKSAPGHTQVHQVLYLKLAKTGGVLLSGDLYHYPEERKLGRVPTFEFNADQTRAARAAIEAFLKETGAQLWIQHDFRGNAALKKSPDFYE